MNITLIILGIVLIVLLYALYQYYYATTATLVTTADLNITNPPIAPVANASSVRYAYGLWIYVHSWNNTQSKTIFSRDGNMSLLLDTTTLKLSCSIYMSDGNYAGISITDNFPLQKWVYVILSVDNQFLDIYLDGKLVKSTRLYKPSTSSSGPIMPATPPGDATPVILGKPNFKFDAQIAKFQKFAAPVDPQTAWSNYVSGSGVSTSLMSANNYNAKLSILKNNAEYTKLSLF